MTETEKATRGRVWGFWLPWLAAGVTFAFAYSRHPVTELYLLILVIIGFVWGGWLAWRSVMKGLSRGGMVGASVVLGFMMAGWISYGTLSGIPYLIHVQGGCGIVFVGGIAETALERVFRRRRGNP